MEEFQIQNYFGISSVILCVMAILTKMSPALCEMLCKSALERMVFHPCCVNGQLYLYWVSQRADSYPLVSLTEVVSADVKLEVSLRIGSAQPVMNRWQVNPPSSTRAG